MIIDAMVYNVRLSGNHAIVNINARELVSMVAFSVPITDVHKWNVGQELTLTLEPKS